MAVEVVLDVVAVELEAGFELDVAFELDVDAVVFFAVELEDDGVVVGAFTELDVFESLDESFL
ncbi:hypothetical protein [Sporolactobacillus inulinus]|uniref:hypothetical protein n=1 Tax=Sporolactobacillus inulinus TaxID=2078 RepID=UPI0021CD05B2|nr:hypothetical protein [Sporolactobacillus inulinus]